MWIRMERLSVQQANTGVTKATEFTSASRLPEPPLPANVDVCAL